MQYSIDKLSAPSLPDHSKELEAGRCYAYLETTRKRTSSSMIRVQVSSNQVTDNLCFVKGINKMSKCTSKQTGNIGATPKSQKGRNLEGKETY